MNKKIKKWLRAKNQVDITQLVMEGHFARLIITRSGTKREGLESVCGSGTNEILI